jgi:superfamily II DNA or RNA helicase
VSAAGTWLWSLDHDQPARVVDEDSLWGERLVRAWLPRRNVVVRISAERLVPIDGTRAPGAEDLVWQAAAARVLDALGRDTLVAPLEAGVIPLPHQLQALAKAVSGDRIRYLLADEVGLGKTIEAGLILRELKIRGLVRRTLVVAPAGIVSQWVDEFRLRFNEKFRLILPAWFATLRDAGGLDEDANLWRLHDQVVCSIDSVKPLEARRGWSSHELSRYNRQRFEDLVSAGWDLIIVDEAHRLGASSEQVARYKLGEALAQAAPYVLLLTATPHQGKTDGFRRLLGFLDEEAFRNDAQLTRDVVAPYVIRTEKRHAIDIQGHPLFKPRRTVLHPVVWAEGGDQHALYEAVSEYVRLGYNQARAEKRNALGFLMLLMQRLVTSSTCAIRAALERRLDVLQLPDGQLSLFGDDIGEDWTALDGQEQMEAALKARLKATRNERAEVELLLSAARRCEARGPDVKAVALLDWITRVERDEQDPNLKVLIFTEFVPTQEMLREFLEARGYSVVCLNGSLGLEERREVQRSFAHAARILVATDAGGEGLNLQFCHVVVNYDLPWNPMKIEQRIGRVDRIGQTRPVLAINMALDGSVELRVRAVLEEKLARILEEFGSDKVSDVLDSETADVDFEATYARALLAPDAVDALVEDLTSKIRQQFADARTATGLFTDTAIDRGLAEKVATSQLPTWVERMTTAFLQSQQHRGGGAREGDDGWHLRWPDGSGNDAVVFRASVRGDAVETITLEDPRVRGILGELGPWAEARPAKPILIPGMSDKVGGVWSLWRVTLQHGESSDQQFVPVFVEEDGRALQPAARLVWDRLIERGFTFGLEDAVPLKEDELTANRSVAEERGADVVAGMVDAHRAKVARDRRAGERAFAARRRAIERLGLPKVRQKRLADLAIELERWGTRLRDEERTVASLDPILMVRVLRDGAGA